MSAIFTSVRSRTRSQVSMELTRSVSNSLISFSEKPSTFACLINLRRLSASSGKMRYPDIERDAREQPAPFVISNGLAVHMGLLGQLADCELFHRTNAG